MKRRTVVKSHAVGALLFTAAAAGGLACERTVTIVGAAGPGGGGSGDTSGSSVSATTNASTASTTATTGGGPFTCGTTKCNSGTEICCSDSTTHCQPKGTHCIMLELDCSGTDTCNGETCCALVNVTPPPVATCQPTCPVSQNQAEQFCDAQSDCPIDMQCSFGPSGTGNGLCIPAG